MCIDSQISHLWDARRKWCQVLSLFFPSSRQWVYPTKEPVPSPLGPSYSEAREWWQLGKWFVPHTHKSYFSSGEMEELALTPPPDLPIALSCKVFHCFQVFASDHLSEVEPLSHFLFPLPVHSWGWAKCTDHSVTTEWYVNHVSGVQVPPRASSDAAWSTADVLTGLSKSQPFAGGSRAQSAASDFQKQWEICTEVEDAHTSSLLSYYLSSTYRMLQTYTPLAKGLGRGILD